MMFGQDGVAMFGPGQQPQQQNQGAVLTFADVADDALDAGVEDPLENDVWILRETVSGATEPAVLSTAFVFVSTDGQRNTYSAHDWEFEAVWNDATPEEQ